MDETRNLFTEGKKAFQMHQYDRAQKAFSRLIQKTPYFADVYNMLGVIHHNAGQFSDATGYFEKALKINPKYTEALLNLAVLYNDLGEYKKARKLYDKVQAKSREHKGSKMDPFIRAKIANRHAEVGDIYEGIGFYKEAVEEYKKALHLGPTFHDIRCKLAICLREQGKHADSVSEFKKVLKANPKYYYAMVQLGVTLYAAGKTKAAIEQWNKVLKAKPDHDGAKMYLRLAETPKK
jgi:tetratricopeptide (TPR) repeat protein